MEHRRWVAAVVPLLGVPVVALCQPVRAVPDLFDELYSTIEVSGDLSDPSDASTDSRGGPSLGPNGYGSALACNFALISNQGDYYSMAYVARWYTPNRGSQIAYRAYSYYTYALQSSLGADPVSGSYGNYICEVEWHVNGSYLWTDQATLNVMPSCGSGDARNELITEYFSGQYGVSLRPECNDFHNSGGSSNFSWSEWLASQGSAHGGYAIDADNIFSNLEDTRSEYNRGRVLITSGYRCPAVNQSIGGAGNSRHQYGDAADLVPLDQTWNESERDLLAAAATRAGASFIEPWGTGSGETTDHVHADWR